jgi:hypothetical protein
MSRLLFVRPADDSTAAFVATVGQAVRQLTSAFASVDLFGTEANRANVDRELSTSSSVLYFGHGSELALTAHGEALIDVVNLHSLGGGLVVAIACHAGFALGQIAGFTHPTVAGFLGFDDEIGFPLQAPLPMGLAIVDGLRCLVTDGHPVGCSAGQLRAAFLRAQLDYKANGAGYGLSPSDVRLAWLFAKSNAHSVRVHGDASATL